MDTLYSLAELPLHVIALIFISLGIGLSAACVLIVNNYVVTAQLIENNFVAGFKFTYLAQVFTGILAFVLIEQSARYSDASAYVNNELNAIGYFDQAMAGLSEAEAGAVRKAVRTYVKSVIEDEFPAMARGKESAEASRKFKDMFAAYAKIIPIDARENAVVFSANQMLMRVADNRTARLSAASGRLQSLLWTTILVGLTASIAWNGFFGSNNLIAQLVMGALLTTANVMTVYYLFIAAFPFIGELGIGPETWKEFLDLPYP